MTTARKLLSGAAWVYGAQLVTVVGQFGYAALTSRAVTPSGFGAYAIALSVTGLVTLLAAGGLGQTASRMVELDRHRLRMLVSYALILGIVAALALFFSAPFWAWLWGSQAALEPIRWLAVSSVFGPLLGLATGLMARKGKFRGLGLITALGNLSGMIIGVVAVLILRTPASLVVSAIVAQLIILVASMLASDGELIGIARFKRGSGDIAYSGKLTSASFLSYLTGNIVKLSMARAIDAASLGYWNRAEVLTTIPFQQVQSALLRAVYPEFRHDVNDTSRARTVWTDMLVFIAWVSLAAGAAAAVLVPPIVPVIFGPGWEVAALLAGPLAIAGGLQIVSMVLNSAIEAIGRFRWIWSSDAILILFQVAAAVLVLIYRDIMIAVATIVFTNVLRHCWQVWIANRHGYINARLLVGQYLFAAAFAVSLAAVLWLAVQLISGADKAPVFWILTPVMLSAFTVLLYMVRRRLPVVVLASKYGLLLKR